MQAIKVYYTGKRAKTGNLCYDERGRMQVFVTYCDTCHSKIAMDLREAEDFAMKWHHEKKRNRFLLSKLERKII